MNNKILVVDDEARMRKLIKDFLTAKNFNVKEAANGQEALDMFFEDSTINLIILDVMMPILDGWATLREIRKTSNVPVIMLTARGEERDELFGFELGVDEYISKPFSPKILVARVEALLKRSFPAKEDIKDFDGIIIDKVSHKVTVDGKEVDMSMKEFELLVYLTDNLGIALSREKILNSVWNYDYFGDSRTIDSHIKKVRKKLGKKGAHIQTVRGLGYKFEL
jgi:DNA-binding response OmpR family regulator